MKKLLVTVLLISSSLAIAETSCPCPGACCPLVAANSMIDIATYLSPWANKVCKDRYK